MVKYDPKSVTSGRFEEVHILSWYMAPTPVKPIEGYFRIGFRSSLLANYEHAKKLADGT